MDVSVKKITGGNYEILFGDDKMEVSAEDIDRLHSQLSAILRPETVAEKLVRHNEFLAKLLRANDNGIQSLLRIADHDDVVILLTMSEKNKDLKKKLYGNMTENAIKMFVEDMNFLMRGDVTNYKIDEAMTRLIKSVEELTENETIIISPP
jgi:flagellar motor switch protein FliG